MSFTSQGFILFLGLLFLAYYIVFRRWQWQCLLVASFIFYGFSAPGNLLYITATIATTYLSTMKMLALGSEKRKRRPWLIGCLLINIGILAVLKYSGFVVGMITPKADPSFLHFAVPLGLSFYTFQSVSYLIDAYRGKKPDFIERNPFKLALFISFFPQLIQGPISRFNDLRQTLFEPHGLCSEELSKGLFRVVFGLFKKLVVADRLLLSVRALVEKPEEYRGIYVLIVVALYAVTLYADFTGGIDMTLGLSQMLGIKLKENFNHPFYSKSIAEYWRRWHITMGTWFRDYIFYPLSVSHFFLKLLKPCRRLFGQYVGGRFPVYIVTLITWFATGLWHGASWNYIVWGVVNGVVILISQELTPLYKRFHNLLPALGRTRIYGAFQVIRTFWLMCFIRSFDIYANVPLTLRMIGTVFTDITDSWIGMKPLGLSLVDALPVGIAIILMIMAGKWKPEKPAGLFSACCILGVAILVFGVYGFGYDMRNFIYEKF